MPTTYNKSTLSTFFAQGDIPQGTDYQNLIYSQVNLVETAEQDMAGPLYTTKLITPKVSAAALNITGAFNAAVVSANSINAATDVLAKSGTVYASAVNSTSGFQSTPVIISAAGTALATATQLTASINRVQGVTDAQNTGVKLLSGRLGWQQTVVNETAVSANLWPAGSDFKINALASGAAFGMLANTQYIVTYTQASAYAVK